ncbi:signal recognition particle-docking protein FtsY [Lactobacillus sp. PV037]|uniref:signal recognition particle-docking protein FtsY n=1 Tax=Lactobacillus sp. PV037 TaxID=2594496 RepID=UPI00224087D5|nr:signal recognition particle-docking protein FtsY [Lactobacillus sp. PV037]QNQ83863.1 signal recognition particle-docking protein FtsY [Lactobacillus sp. PV037]
MGLFDKIKKSLFGKKKSEEPVSQEPENQELKSETVESEQENQSETSSEVSEVSATSEEEKPQTSTSPVVEQESEDKEKSEEIAPQENAEISSDTEEEAREEEKSESPLISEETAAADPNEESIEEEEIEESTPAEEDKETDQEKYDRGLKKTNSSFGAKLNAFFARFRSVDEEFFDELEDLLIESDVGFETAVQLTDSLRDEAKLQKAKSHDELKEVIVEKLVDIYDKGGEGKNSTLTYNPDAKPNVYLFVGVNGAGKTTTIGKLAKRIKDSGKTVMMVAADTFRAGAVEQLVEWGKRDNVEVITGKEKADPASVVYDGVKQAQEKGVDYLLVDTAGRLQNKVNLMNELDKIERTIKKILPEQPEEVLLVLDGSTGQNALLQAKDFDKTTKLTGLVLTKLDGSSKGGVVLAIRNEMDLPVKLVGLGEKVDDLADFDAEKFAIGLFQGLI